MDFRQGQIRRCHGVTRRVDIWYRSIMYMWIKRACALGVALSVVLSIACAAHADVDSRYESLQRFGWQLVDTRNVPRQRIEDEYGDRRSFRDIVPLERTVLINFWATWCAPCIAELPHLVDLRREYADREFDVLLINNQETKKQIEKFEHDFDIDLMSLRDYTGRLAASLGVRGMPVSFLINRDGRIVARYVGVLNLQDAEFHAILQSLL